MSSLHRRSSDRETGYAMSKCHSENSTKSSGSSQPSIHCIITTADYHAYSVTIDPKAEAGDVLKTICKRLGIMDESEYFGLKLLGKQNEFLWLNLRNRLSKQLHGQGPYNLYLRVKYFVEPHRLIQEETKRQFFLNIVEHFQIGDWLTKDMDLQAISEIIALMTHTNHGAFNATSTPCKYACFWPETRGEIPKEVLRNAANFHQKLSAQNSIRTQYEVMRQAHSSLCFYGSHFFEVTYMYGNSFKIGVGPDKIFICFPDGRLAEEMLYSRLSTVYLSAKVVTLNVLDDTGAVKARHYELKSRQLAQCLYRCITEIHAFFQSDTISNQVLEQTNAMFMESLTSLFDHNKDFAFDVKMTAQEVYDKALRNAYRLTQALSSRENIITLDDPSSPAHKPGPKFDLPGDDASSCEDVPAVQSSIPASAAPVNFPVSKQQSPASSAESMNSSLSDISSQVEEVIRKELKQRTQCQLCCERDITKVFLPCGHAYCCSECSERIVECPVCRETIEQRQQFYPPWNTNTSTNSVNSLVEFVMKNAATHTGSDHDHHHHHHQHHLHLHMRHSQSTGHSKEELMPTRKVTLTGPSPSHKPTHRQSSISTSSVSTSPIASHDPRRIRTYSDFQGIQSIQATAGTSSSCGGGTGRVALILQPAHSLSPPPSMLNVDTRGSVESVDGPQQSVVISKICLTTLTECSSTNTTALATPSAPLPLESELQQPQPTSLIESVLSPLKLRVKEGNNNGSMVLKKSCQNQNTSE